MHTEGNEVHSEVDEARAGSTPNVLRWILAISLIAAIALLSAIWIFGATTTNPPSEQVEETQTALDQTDQGDTGEIGDLNNMPTPEEPHLEDGVDVIDNSAN